MLFRVVIISYKYNHNSNTDTIVKQWLILQNHGSSVVNVIYLVFKYYLH